MLSQISFVTNFLTMVTSFLWASRINSSVMGHWVWTPQIFTYQVWITEISPWKWFLYFLFSLLLQISYTGVGKTQLNFLRLLSEKATQTINMMCIGSQGCFDSKSNAVEKAIRLQGANDGVLSLMKNDPSVKITKVLTWKKIDIQLRQQASVPPSLPSSFRPSVD